MQKGAKQSPSQGEKDLNAKKHSVSMKERTTIELDKNFVEYCKWHIGAFGAHEGKTIQDLIVEAVQDQVNLERSTGNGMETLIFEDRLSGNSCVEEGAIPLSEFMDRVRGELGKEDYVKRCDETREETGEPYYTKSCLECGNPVSRGLEFCSLECQETHETKARPIVVKRAGFTATVVLNGIERMTPHARRETKGHLHNALADFECNMASGHFFDLTPIPEGFMVEKND